MGRSAEVFVQDRLAGIISETDEGYSFVYDGAYLDRSDALPVSLTMPLTSEIYISNILFPFFDGLIPEGWLLETALRNWKIDYRDRFGMLLVACRDCVGDVCVIQVADD